jgi:hypothetical protein
MHARQRESMNHTPDITPHDLNCKHALAIPQEAERDGLKGNASSTPGISWLSIRVTLQHFRSKVAPARKHVDFRVPHAWFETLLRVGMHDKQASLSLSIPERELTHGQQPPHCG